MFLFLPVFLRFPFSVKIGFENAQTARDIPRFGKKTLSEGKPLESSLKDGAKACKPLERSFNTDGLNLTCMDDGAQVFFIQHNTV